MDVHIASQALQKLLRWWAGGEAVNPVDLIKKVLRTPSLIQAISRKTVPRRAG